MNPAIIALQDEVRRTVGVAASAAVVIRGVPALVQAARDAALAEGATPEVLAVLDQLKVDLDTAADDLEAAVSENPS